MKIYRRGITIRNWPQLPKTVLLRTTQNNIQVGRGIILTKDRQMNLNISKGGLTCGVLKEHSGQIHLGYWKDAKLIGCMKDNSNICIGMFINGKLIHGIEIQRNYLYSGRFPARDFFRATIIQQAFIYSGGFHKGQYHAYGVLIWIKDRKRIVYKGQFRAGQFNGQGLSIVNQSQLCGKFKNDKLYGNASCLTLEHFYTGQLIDGEKHGAGVYIFIENFTLTRYDGIFQHSLVSCQGIVRQQQYRNKHKSSENTINVSCHVIYYCGQASVSLFNGLGTFHKEVYNGDLTGNEITALQFMQIQSKILNESESLKLLIYSGFNNIQDCSTNYSGEFSDSQFDGEGILTVNNITQEWKQYKKGIPADISVKKVNDQVQVTFPNRRSLMLQGFSDDDDIMMKTQNGMYQGQIRIIYEPINNMKTEVLIDKGEMVKYNTKHQIKGSGYSGDMKDGKQHGKGTLIDEFGNKYYGDWVNNQKHGYGVYETQKLRYEGQFEFDRYCGQGVLKQYEDGYIIEYNGAMIDSKPHGQGKFISPEFEYEGEFHSGIRQGQGILTYKNGEYFQGEFLNNQFNGYGVREQPSKLKYEGFFLNSEYHGKGKLSNFERGTVYEGNFQSGILDGYGILEKFSKWIYSGFFKNNLFEGKGKMEYQDGTVYKGEFSECAFNGQGKLIFSDLTYVGQFIRGNHTGNGEITYSIGGVYTGQHSEYIMHGRGTLGTDDGDIIEGGWVEGKLEGQAIVKTNQGSFYTGNWFNNKPNGVGLLRWRTRGSNYCEELFSGNIQGQVIEYDWNSQKMIIRTESIRDYDDQEEHEYEFDGIWQNGQYSQGKLSTKDKEYQGNFYNGRVCNSITVNKAFQSSSVSSRNSALSMEQVSKSDQ